MSDTEIAILAIVISVVALSVAFWQAILNAQATHQSTVYSSVYAGFSDRKLVSRQSLQIGEETYEYLRRAQTEALKSFRADRNRWRERSHISAQGNWENIVAYETAQALEDIGSGIFVGAVPMRLVVPLVAGSIVDNWLICRDWVASYRTLEPFNQLDDVHMPYHRANGEWLVLVTALWLRRHYSDDTWKEIVEPYGGVHAAEDRIRRLSARPGNPIPLDVCWSVWKYARVFVP